MELREIFGIIRKWLVLIIIITVLAAIASGAVSIYVLDEIYEAKSVMIISSTKNDSEIRDITYSEFDLNVKLVNTYRELCKTDKILNQVIEQTGHIMSTEALSNKIDVTSAAGTQLIRFSVQDNNPSVAMEIANALVTVLESEVPAIMKMDNVQIIDMATLPKVPVKPNIPLNIAVAALLGLMLSVGIAFLIEYLDVSIKTTEKMEEILGIPILGTIPHIIDMKSGEKK